MKFFGSVLTVIAIGFFGFCVTVIAALSVEGQFYAPYFAAVTAGLIIIIILAIYGQLKKKAYRLSAIFIVCICVLAVALYEGYQAYLESLEIVSTQDFDLSDYRPFSEGSKAVTLDEASTLKIKEDLPVLDGATALYPVYASFVQAVYPEKMYPLEESEVVSTQTNNSFDRLLAGEVDIIFMAEPSESQQKRAEQQGVDLEMTPIGREAFVFFVHKDNPVEELTLTQIQNIYAGEISNWNEVGGADQEIKAFQRPEGSGSQSALINVMDGVPLMDAPAEEIVSGMGGVIRETAEFQNRRNAMGFSFRNFSQDMVQNGKIDYIAVNGVSPTKENIQNGTYPIIDKFYAITRENDNPHVEDFINWMTSSQGQEIVDKTGYIPIK
ncbi:PstS family phosphate ABC transporter substrate-binding protein [Sediminibacillus massiliensis]|uniref:PstS family phosphate ABC transporter substrate-binding protein n=1 Tax=Sediminibacillus massiliensis TaxID=1926277 RepID=UPI0009887985|nr:substrate-binding domain-containing protein [Sediminibacillus massiliensis]